MEYMTVKDAETKWNISERRIRKLLLDGRIEGATKIGNSWNIPITSSKPVDKRNIKEKENFIIDLPDNYFYLVDMLKEELDKQIIPSTTLKSLKESIDLEWTYNSIAIEGNSLTLKETKVVLEGFTIGGKSLKDHIEVINHDAAIIFLDELVKDEDIISEWNITQIHGLILRSIDNYNAGKYRSSNVLISGARHIPPEYLHVPELMEKLILRYKNWYNYHPIVKACLLHGELVKIHPFVDGNGRTSRLVMNLVLIKTGYLPIIIKNDYKLEYYEALDKAHVENEYTDFIKMTVDLEIEMINRYKSLL